MFQQSDLAQFYKTANAALTAIRTWKIESLTQLQTKPFVDKKGKPVDVMDLILQIDQVLKEVKDIAYKLTFKSLSESEIREAVEIITAKLSYVETGSITTLKSSLQIDIGQDPYILNSFNGHFLVYLSYLKVLIS